MLTDLDIEQHEFSLKYEYCRERYIEFHVGDLLCLRLAGVENNSGQLKFGFDYQY